MRTPCDNHPAKAGENLCDSCDRYLCAECLGAPIDRYGRIYYFCNKEACRRAYVAKVKKEGLALAGLVVVWLMLIVTCLWTDFTNIDLVLVCGLTPFTWCVKLWREYQQRQWQ